MKNRVAVFIDAGYLTKVLEEYYKPKIDYYKLVNWSCEKEELLRAYYYDCPPYQSANPTQEEREKMSKKQSFFAALESNPRFTLRQGRLELRGYDDKGKPIFAQKKTDLQLGIDVARIVTKKQVEVVVIISGDSDFVPLVQFAQREGAIVRLVHGPKNSYHRELWKIVDERKEITEELLYQIKLQKKPPSTKKVASLIFPDPLSKRQGVFC